MHRDDLSGDFITEWLYRELVRNLESFKPLVDLAGHGARTAVDHVRRILSARSDRRLAPARYQVVPGRIAPARIRAVFRVARDTPGAANAQGKPLLTVGDHAAKWCTGESGDANPS